MKTLMYLTAAVAVPMSAVAEAGRPLPLSPAEQTAVAIGRTLVPAENRREFDAVALEVADVVAVLRKIAAEREAARAEAAAARAAAVSGPAEDGLVLGLAAADIPLKRSMRGDGEDRADSESGTTGHEGAARHEPDGYQKDPSVVFADPGTELDPVVTPRDEGQLPGSTSRPSAEFLEDAMPEGVNGVRRPAADTVGEFPNQRAGSDFDANPHVWDFEDRVQRFEADGFQGAFVPAKKSGRRHDGARGHEFDEGRRPHTRPQGGPRDGEQPRGGDGPPLRGPETRRDGPPAHGRPSHGTGGPEQSRPGDHRDDLADRLRFEVQVEQMERMLELTELETEISAQKFERFEGRAEIASNREAAAMWAVEALCERDPQGAAKKLRSLLQRLSDEGDGSPAVASFIRMKLIEMSARDVDAASGEYERLIIGEPPREGGGGGGFF